LIDTALFVVLGMRTTVVCAVVAIASTLLAVGHCASTLASLQWLDIPLQCATDGSKCEDYAQFVARINDVRAHIAAVPDLCQEVGVQTAFVAARLLLTGSGRVATASIETKGILTAAAYPPDSCSDGKNCNGDRYPSTHPNYLEAVDREVQVLRMYCLTNDPASLLEMAPRYDPNQPIVPSEGFLGSVVSIPILQRVPLGPWKVIPTQTSSAASSPRTPNPDGLPRLALASALMAHFATSSSAQKQADLQFIDVVGGLFQTIFALCFCYVVRVAFT
jgi:hypothetical protein